MAETYGYELIGTMPMLQHNNNLDAQAEIATWIGGEGRSMSVAGDDRSPVWTWTNSLYVNPEGYLSLPSHCLMAALRIGGSKVKAPQAMGMNWSKPSQFGIGLQEDWLDILVAGKRVPVEPILKLKRRDYMMHPSDFPKHKADADKLGVTLQVVPVVNPTTKKRNIRVRPMLKEWRIKGVLKVNFPAINLEILEKIFTASGQYGGLLDWSPHSRKPGPYGTYEVVLKHLAEGRKSA